MMEVGANLRRISASRDQCINPKYKRPKRESVANKKTQNCENLLNLAFVNEEQDNYCFKIPKPNSTSRQNKRRLSGLYRRDLNTGFIEEVNYEEEDNATFYESALNMDQYNESNEKENIISPMKSKLRKIRAKKEPTEEELVKIYTNTSVKKKHNTLETIFEVPKPDLMGVKKFKRFINFNERMSKVKIKKRKSKIRKYNLLEINLEDKE